MSDASPSDAARRAAATPDAPSGHDAWTVDDFGPVPGDRLLLPAATARRAAESETDATVQTIYLCSEPEGERLVRWTWIILDDGRLLEIAPRGCALYDPPTVLRRGSGPFMELAAQDGALVRFEERVRAGVWEARPVRLTLDRRSWRLTATGTVAAQRLGPRPASAWGQLRTSMMGHRRAATAAPRPWNIETGRTGTGLATAAEDGPAEDGPAEQDVYFTLVGQARGTDVADRLSLGVWMRDLCLAFGRRLGDTPRAAGLEIVPRRAPDA
ncbi:MAG: hypothetical protein IT306_19610 [Chloroflexi bacterium]|nr:hypothetical protein [Chloroflexota bacterium]